MTPKLATRPRCRRQYTVSFSGPGYAYVWPTMYIRSTARIRWFAMDYFQRFFGRPADLRIRSWHKDGFMAEAADRRGYIVTVEQTNWGDPRHTDGTWDRAPIAVPSTPLLLTWPADQRRAS